MKLKTASYLLLAAKLTAVTATLATAAMLSACNTVQGIGHDITAVGEGGQDMIDDATGSRSSTARHN